MLKKKINGVWQNCYVVKNKLSGSWVDITRSAGKKLQRYTNGSWYNTIYYPTIDILSKTISGTSLIYDLDDSDLRIYGDTNNETEQCILRLGSEPVQAGETFSMRVYMHYGTDADSSVTRSMTFYVALISLISPERASIGSFTTITELCRAVSDGVVQQTSFYHTYSYTFTNSYPYVGIVMYVSSRNFYYRYTGISFAIYKPTISSSSGTRTLSYGRDLTT